MKGIRFRWGWLTVLLLVIGYVLPGSVQIPVQGASLADWNAETFWYEPWGLSGVHKGIDIFAKQGQAVVSATPGLRLFSGTLEQGGNVVAILGPQWRIHYYAHLHTQTTAPLFVRRGRQIGMVGTTGNAAGKPPHLHYSVVSLVPLPWRYSQATQGWKQMFFLNPHELLKESGTVRSP